MVGLLSGGGARGISVLGFGANGLVPAGGGSLLAWDSGGAAIFAALETAIDTQCHIIAPRAGILRNFFGRISAAEGVGITIAWTVRVNQANTALTFQTSGGAQVTNSDVVNTVAVAAGDLIAVGMTRVAGVPATPRRECTMEFV